MRLLLIDEEAKAKLKALVEHAELNKFSMDDMLDVLNKAEPMAGDMEGFSCEIPIGYRVVFSLEEQVPGLTKHLSVSVDRDEELPHPHTVQAIMEELGFTKKLDDCRIKLEDISPKRQAVNVWEVPNE